MKRSFQGILVVSAALYGCGSITDSLFGDGDDDGTHGGSSGNTFAAVRTGRLEGRMAMAWAASGTSIQARRAQALTVEPSSNRSPSCS